MKVYLLKTTLAVSISFLIMLSSMQMPVNGLESKEVINTKADDGWLYYPPYPNYSPAGMPDFTCCQDSCWMDEYEIPYRVSHDSLSFANILWYLDSMFSNQNGTPGDGKDDFPLVPDFNAPSDPNPGPYSDDHNFNNVDDLGTHWDPYDSSFKGELVETITQYIGLDGITNNVQGINNYLKEVNLTEYFKIERIFIYYDHVYPTFEDIVYYFNSLYELL